MNDDFENHLAKIPLKSPPNDWRDQILGPNPAATKTEIPWWRELLWPCPQAWAGMAALWVVMFAMNWEGISSPRKSTATATIDPSPSPSPSPYSPARIAELLEEEFPFPEDATAEPPAIRKSPADRPRSCRPIQTAFA